MDELINDTIAYLKQEFKSDETVIAPSDDFDFFQEKKQPPPMPKPQKAVDLEPSAKPLHDDMEEIRQKVGKAAPHLRLAAAIPEDTEAKKIANMWQEHLKNIEAAVLSFGETGASLEFLQSVAKAIDALLVPCKVIDALRFEKEKKWNLFFESYPLKLVLAPDIRLWKSTSLAAFYKENPASSSSSLGPSPLLFLQPAPTYLKNPKEKRALWKLIVSQLSS
jgi:hypothetical protein